MVCLVRALTFAGLAGLALGVSTAQSIVDANGNAKGFHASRKARLVRSEKTISPDGEVDVGSYHEAMPVTPKVLIASSSEAVCSRPTSWCNPAEPGNTYAGNKDCDGDGIADPFCTNGEQSGYISSRCSCVDTWPNGPCNPEAQQATCCRPPGWCNGDATFDVQDCDGDGIADPFCSRGENNGYISSKRGCVDTWPDSRGKCRPNSQEVCASYRDQSTCPSSLCYWSEGTTCKEMYALGDANTMECPAGYNKIEDMSTCKLAADALDHYSYYGPGAWATAPGGCVADSKANAGKYYVSYNGHSGAASASHMPVCRATLPNIVPIPGTFPDCKTNNEKGMCTECTNGTYLSLGECAAQCPPGHYKTITGSDFRQCQKCEGETRRRRVAESCTPCPNGHVSETDSDTCRNAQDTCNEAQCNTCLECINVARPKLQECLNASEHSGHCLDFNKIWCDKFTRKVIDCQGFSYGCYLKLLCHSPDVCPEWKTVRCGGNQTDTLLPESSALGNQTDNQTDALLPESSALEASDSLSKRGSRVNEMSAQSSELDSTLAGKCSNR